MKHIIIEGGDRLGKDTLIKSLCEHFNYDNVTIRHFGKPPKGMSPKETLDFQFNAFYKEATLVNYITETIDGDQFGYFDNVIIWNRSHLGEYVYSQMFRGISKRDVSSKLEKFEMNMLGNDTYLITVTAGSEFFLKQEDGDSFSQTLVEKERELKLFKEFHHASIIPNKLLLKVDNAGHFRKKEKIFSEVLEFLKLNNNGKSE